MAFTIGQRVRLTINVPSMWEGGFAPRAGATGTITHTPSMGTISYGVLLDADPDQMPASFAHSEITPA